MSQSNAYQFEDDPSALLEEADALSRTSLRGALDLADKALDLATKKENSDQINDVLSLRAQFHAQLGQYSEGIADSERALAGYGAAGNERGRASVLNTLGIIKENSGDYTESFKLQTECLEILRQMDSPASLAQVASNIGLTCTYLGDWDQAVQFYRESLAAWEELPPQTGKGLLLVNLGFAHVSIGEYAIAENYYREALEIFGDNDPLRACLVYTNLACARLETGDREEAYRFAEIALKQSEQQEDPARKAHALDCMGSVLCARGDEASARELLEKALFIYRGIPIPRGCALVLNKLASLSADDPDAADQLLREAEQMARQSGLKPVLIDILQHFHELSKRRGAWEDACRFIEQKVNEEKDLLKDRARLRLISLRLELKLEQSQRETELQRLRAKEFAETVANLEEQKKVAEEENRQKSEILHFAAHDLRNLLWGILGPAELLEEERGKLEHLPEITELMDCMHRSTRVLQETLHNILVAAAAESGEVSLNREPVALGDLVSEAAIQWRPAAKAKNQQIEQVDENRKITHSLDRSRMLDCLNNLISNAIKYSPPGSVVRVGIELVDEGVAVFVADEGPGLSEEDRRRAGRLFQRLSAQPTANELSVGVGLAVVKRFSELHGGKMDIECPSDGGSVFRIILPQD